MKALAIAVLLGLPRAGMAQATLDPTGLILRPGDVIRVEIWQEPDLSGDFHVSAEGVATVPLLGAIQAGGRTWRDVRDTMLAGYQRELRNPSIRLTPLRRVHVLGEVHQPGIYAVDPTLTLVGAIAMAGGATEIGDIKNLSVVRDGVVVLERVPAESVLASVDIRSGDQVFVGRRGWFDRNSTFVVSMVLSAASIIVTLAAR